jgi:hypothetical protein
MSDHPDATFLDALAIGEADAATRAHVDACAACGAYVAELRAGADLFAREEAPRAAAFVAEVRRRARSEPASAWRWRRAGGAVSVLALAAGLALFVRARPPIVSPPPTIEPSPVRFKGDMQLAVIVEHLGSQTRQTGALQLEPGDRIRLEIALDHEVRMEAGVLTDDGEWASLEPALLLAPGTHYSEEAITFTDSVPRGQILVGESAAVAEARQRRDFGAVTTIPLGPKAR